MKTKTLEIQDAQIKATDPNSYQFEGYASVFGDVDSYGDSIVQGAYAKTLVNRKRPVQMYKNHSNAIIIGKWLDLHEDQHGLYVKGELTPGHSLAEDVYASLKHGAVTGLSIGYRVVDSEPQNGITFLKEIDLIEVSVVNTPADLNAQISSVKEFNEALAEIEDIRALEKFFRDEFDLSQTKSKALITCIKGAMHERDVHSVEEDQRDVGSSTKASIESQLYEAIKNLKV